MCIRDRLRTLRETKEKITLVPLGPVTNIGMALRMDPSIAQNIEGIVVMGGGVHEANKSMAAESNFFNDPEAAKIVLECGEMCIRDRPQGTPT